MTSFSLTTRLAKQHDKVLTKLERFEEICAIDEQTKVELRNELNLRSKELGLSVDAISYLIRRCDQAKWPAKLLEDLKTQPNPPVVLEYRSKPFSSPLKTQHVIFISCQLTL